MDLDRDDIVDCTICKYGKISYTEMVTGAIIPEWYCKLTNDDGYCGGEDFEEEE